MSVCACFFPIVKRMMKSWSRRGDLQLFVWLEAFFQHKIGITQDPNLQCQTYTQQSHWPLAFDLRSLGKRGPVHQNTLICKCVRHQFQIAVVMFHEALLPSKLIPLSSPSLSPGHSAKKITIFFLKYITTAFNHLNHHLISNHFSLDLLPKSIWVNYNDPITTSQEMMIRKVNYPKKWPYFSLVN